MSDIGAPRHDPVPIGEIATPPFARLPDPAKLFKTRAERLRFLAPSHHLGPYLRFLADLSDIQHPMAGSLPLSHEVVNIISKAILSAAKASSFEEALEIGYRAFSDVSCTEAAKEGISAFMEKRSPRFET